jgi:hypothetical protein
MAMPIPKPVHPAAVIAAVLLAAAGGAAAIVALSRGRAEATASAAVAAPPAPARHAVPPPPTLIPAASHSVHILMAGLVDPAADGIWNSAGSIVTPASEETWAPATDEDWRRLEGHARALARGADALIDPARVNGREDWAVPARALGVASAAALAAAQRRDTGAIYAASEQLLDACQQCHTHYWLPTESAP